MFSAFRQDSKFYKTLALIAFPIAGQSLISFSLSVTDTFFLGLIGESEIAAATFANSPFFILTLIIFGTQSGASVLISQYHGKGDRDTINQVVGIASIIAFIIALGFALVTFLFPYEIMSFFTKSHHLRVLAAEYMTIASFAFPISVFSQMLFSAHRSMGNATTGFIFSLITAILNVVLNSIFIFGLLGFPRMEVAGAALGTLIARIVEFFIAVVYSRKSTFYKVDFAKYFRPSRKITKDYVHYAGPVVLNELFWGTASALYPIVYDKFGEEVVAAYSIGVNVERLFAVFGRGVGDAACVMVGGEIGKNNFDKAKSYARTLIGVAVVVGIIMGIALVLSSPFIVDIFEVSDYTKHVLSIFFVILAIRTPFLSLFYTMLIGLMRAGGDTKFGMIVDASSIWICGLGLAFLITSITSNLWIIFISKIIDEMVKSLIISFRMKSGAWINNITVDMPTSFKKDKLSK